MIKLSTGQNSTLGSYREMVNIFFGEGSAQAKFIDGKIAESPNGENEEVLADEGQMIQLLASMG